MATINIIMKERGLCNACGIKPVAINCWKNDKVYYRNRCDQCYRKKKKPKPAGWIRSGYTKKEKCEKCGFKFKHVDQSLVYHVDGNLDHNDWLNLKTVCANCSIELSNSKERWKPSKLRPDF
jgi:hypothetical protein